MELVRPMFSIITPTLSRQSLIRCCESVNEQTFESWEHIVAIDGGEYNEALMAKVEHPKRIIFQLLPKRGNFGNQARHAAWNYASGDYLVYLDDDNEMLHINALAEIQMALESANYPPWGLFAIMRHGWWFLMDPPGMCHTDSANMVVQRDLGRWPDIVAREADGVLAERLKEHPYVAFPKVKPIILMERSSNGV